MSNTTVSELFDQSHVNTSQKERVKEKEKERKKEREIKLSESYFGTGDVSSNRSKRLCESTH
jgi:hypothetical protein